MKTPKTKRSPLRFFLLVYLLSVPLWVIEVFVDKGGFPLDIPMTDLLAAFAPLVAAVILLFSEEGSIGVKNLLIKSFAFKSIGVKWYVVILLFVTLIFLLIYSVMFLTGVSLPENWCISYYSIPFLFFFFMLGSAGEEIGYMGYAFKSLNERWGALMTSIIIGIPWAVWHYPSMIQQGRNVEWIFWGTLGTVAMRVLIVSIFGRTGGSLFACILFHALYNLGRTLFPQDANHNPLVDFPEIHYAVIAIIALLMVFGFGEKRENSTYD